MNANIAYEGDLTQENLAAYHIELCKKAVPVLIDALGGENAVHELGREYRGEGENFNTQSAITLRLAGINSQTGRYEGLLANIYYYLTGKDINITSSDPLSVMRGFVRELFKQYGYMLSEEEKLRRQSILQSRPAFWDNEKIEQMRMLCNDRRRKKSWAEIGDYFNVSADAALIAAGRYGVSKPRSIMDVAGRHSRLVELCSSGGNLTLEEIGREIGISHEESHNITSLLSLYCKNLDIQIPDMRSVRSRARRLASGIWFRDEGAALKDLKFYLEATYPESKKNWENGPDKYGLSQSQIGQIMGLTQPAISAAKKHLMIEDPSTGELRMRTDEELEKYIQEIIMFIAENES